MHIALVGPCAPRHVVDLMDPPSAQQAREAMGYPHIAVSALAKALHSAGHQVTVATVTYDDGDDDATFSGPNFQLVMVRGRRRPREYLRDLYARERRSLAQHLRAARPQIVNAHWTYEFELAAQDSGLTHVTTAHDAPLSVLRHLRDPYRLARLGVAMGARRRIEHLSVVSPYLERRWHRQMRFRAPIKVIPNCVPLDIIPAQRRPAEDPVLLSVADAGRLKNARGMLSAFRLIRQSVPHAQLRLAGHGLGTAGVLAAWAAQHELDAGVSFLGYLERDELAQEYAQAWLVVNPSLEESFSLTALEATASGVAVVAGAASGGISYVLDEGRAGWLTDVTDPRALAATVIPLVTNGPADPPRGAAAYIEKNFSPSQVAARYVDWYSSVLAAKGRGG